MAVVSQQGFERLVILSKPGYGKTTFLQYLAVSCSHGDFRPDCVPVLLELRDLHDEILDIQKWLHTELSCATPDDTETLLKQGRVLLLLDGLDEVPSDWQAQFQTKLRSFFKHNERLSVIITCRTQPTNFIPNGFECVEIAEFNSKQVEQFVKRWFKAAVSAQGANQSRQFLAALAGNPAAAELMRTPLLLSFACDIFESRNDFPAKKLELYKEGIELLLDRWDNQRPGGARKRPCHSEIYKALTLEQRQDLLSYLAFQKFTHPQALSNGKLNFILYEQREIEHLIAKKLNKTLSECREIAAVIESQHGLIVARTRTTWSFSHLTFQEYFTAREIVANADYEQLVEHITEPRWREIFLLTVAMMSKADVLVQLMKKKIDHLIDQDVESQQFLARVAEQSRSVETSCKPAAVRAFYFDLARHSDFNLFLIRYLNNAFDHYFGDPFELNRVFGRYLALTINTTRALDLVLALNIDPNFDLNLALALSPELQSKWQVLNQENYENLPQWWRDNGQQWLKELRTIMIDYRNIGYDWQLSDGKRQLLQQYYDANKLLVDCLNSDCSVSPHVRQEIEAMLLLPP
jgi:predicted NACHT family NTPase